MTRNQEQLRNDPVLPQPLFRRQSGNDEFPLEVLGVPGQEAIGRTGVSCDLRRLNGVSQAHGRAHLRQDLLQRAPGIVWVFVEVWEHSQTELTNHLAW